MTAKRKARGRKYWADESIDTGYLQALSKPVGVFKTLIYVIRGDDLKAARACLAALGIKRRGKK